MSVRCPRLVTALLIAMSLALGGCEALDKLNPFEEKQTPLPGARKPLFPEGVPGVDFGAPPPQPSNSNIPIPANTGPAEAEPRAPQAPARTSQSTKSAPAEPAAQSQPQPAKTTKSKKSGDPDDAWSGAR
ncbi:MAG TPA: hypothetical protein VH765_10065 [Xanthobacteraceae bacterium]|jgi:hypothetical protein